MAISTFPAPSVAGGAAKEKRVDLFTATGSFTAPVGVNHVIVHLVGGGGGGGGKEGYGASGSPSSFNGTTYSGGRGAPHTGQASSGGVAGLANTGQGGSGAGGFSFSSEVPAQDGADSNVRMQGVTVTPGSSFAVVVGAGGAGGGGSAAGGAGGSGYVAIEYYVEA